MEVENDVGFMKVAIVLHEGNLVSAFVMVEVRGVTSKIAPRALKGLRVCVLLMEVVAAVNILNVLKVHKGAQNSVRLMVEEKGATF